MTALSSHPDRGFVDVVVQDVPADLHAALERIAAKNGRTLNAQFIHIMVRSLAIENRLDQAATYLANLRNPANTMAEE